MNIYIIVRKIYIDLCHKRLLTEFRLEIMPVPTAEYIDLAAIIGHVIALHTQNMPTFGESVNRLEKNAMKTYIGLIAYFEKQKSEEANVQQRKLQQLITPDRIFQNLNEADQSLKDDEELSEYLVDLFEVYITTNNKCCSIEMEEFYSCAHKYLRSTLGSEKTEVITVYLEILHRINRIDEIPIEILKTIVEAIHGSFNNNAKLLTEALLLIESSLEKRRKSQMQSSASEHLLNFIWHDFCSREASKHQCNGCYTIIAQLIKIYLGECQRNELFRVQFLSSKLWHFIRAGIISKEMLRHEQ